MEHGEGLGIGGGSSDIEGDGFAINFESEEPIKACPLRKPGDEETCEACQ